MITKIEVFKYYQKIFKSEQMFLTGSTALQMLGLIQNSNDVDIVLVKPDPTTLELLKRLNQPSPDIIDSENYELAFQFFHQYNGQQIKVDIFVEKVPEKVLMIYSIPVSTPLQIVSAKQRYRRLKDIMQLKNIAEQFYTPKLLEDWLANEQKIAKSKITYQPPKTEAKDEDLNVEDLFKDVKEALNEPLPPLTEAEYTHKKK